MLDILLCFIIVCTIVTWQTLKNDDGGDYDW
jgi:hypothetical protein